MEKRLKLYFTVIAAAGACCSEAAYWIFPENPGIRTICKAVTAVCILACAVSGGNRKGREFWWMIAALAAASKLSLIMIPVAIPLIALGVGMVYTLKSRIKEIRSGEEDDLSDY